QDGSALGGTQDEGSPLMISLGKGTLRFGLDEGVVSMKEGGKRQLIVPPSLAFGESGYPPAVPPNATLILEMELLRVIPPAEPVPRTEVAEGDYASTPSGLKYFDIREGNGDSPQEEGQFVVVHYTGWLTDGTKFDSSVDGGEPLSFRYGVDPMIQGFVEGVSTMKVGGKRQLVIPPELGYGAQAAGSIPANSTLVFEVELLYVDQR
ncbi:MAG: FKBP-type peptidyl-prolyl cis-trans isomerase, partial [Chloroflexi bacterium]|nr:FKBP-type peptidyl-prolyl cis-trans isomerase [Chloroflexota bacterium]